MDYPKKACLFELVQVPGGTLDWFMIGDVVEFNGYPEDYQDCIYIQPAFTRERNRGFLDGSGFLATRQALWPLTPVAEEVMAGLQDP